MQTVQKVSRNGRDIRDLLRSIFLDYYTSSLLLWKGTKENFEALCGSLTGAARGVSAAL